MEAFARRRELQPPDLRYCVASWSGPHSWQAMDPKFDPQLYDDDDDDAVEVVEETGRSRRASTSRLTNVTPNIRIQLLTTSDGQKLGGLRLDNTRPRVHSEEGGPECNKRRWGSGCSCRKEACMVDGFSQVRARR